MSRPAPTARPTHIPMPPGSPLLAGRSPGGTPMATPAVPSPTSPRASFLPSFMRTRSRANTVTSAVAGTLRGRVASPSTEVANPLASTDSRSGMTRSISTPLSSGIANEVGMPIVLPPIDPALRRTHRIGLVPLLDSSRSFAFTPVQREMGVMQVPLGIAPSVAAAAVTDVGPTVNGHPPPLLLKIGRFTDRSPALPVSNSTASADGSTLPPGAAAGMDGTTNPPRSVPSASTTLPGGGGGDLLSARAAFRSKVVSRSHAEIWCEPGGKFFIRDTASSSGTFLNHIRLSSPNVQSRPQPIKDGDVLQFGVDYQGGAEDMYRCVKMRVEIGRDWQRSANEFNTNALKQLNALRGDEAESTSVTPISTSRKAKASVTDCCICLFSVTVCQSLFIAPCSHVFHYKCIRPLLQQHYPGFSCPLCRTFANLEEDVETEDAWEIASRRASVISRRASNHSIRLPPATETAAQHPVSVSGMPSTGVGFGESSASIDELLAGSSGRPSGELARQTTAVGEMMIEREATGVDTPEPVQEEDEWEHHASESHAIPISAASGETAPSTTAASLAQTPLNDVFLSSLVITPGLQRFADSQSTGSSRRSHDVVNEEPIAEAEAAAADAEEAGSELEQNQHSTRVGEIDDADFMFS